MIGANIMDRRIQIWNILHDGEITAISGEDGNKVIMFVSIPYLRRRLEPLGDSLVVTLSGLIRLEFHNFDGTTTPLREAIEIGTPEVLFTESESMPIKIETTMGQLILDFQSIGFALDTGQAIEYEAIEKVGEEYWTEWKAKTKRSAPPDAAGPRR
jgi:hypothetical protein